MPPSRPLGGYEPDPVPPPAVCINATTPTRPGNGNDSLTSRRTGHGKQMTQRSTIAQAQATATCPTGLLNPDAEWHGEQDGPSPCPLPRYIYRVESPEARRVAPASVLCGTQARSPPPCSGRSDAFTAAAALWVPRGCLCPPPGPLARMGHSGQLATVRAARFVSPPRARVSGVSPITRAGAGQGLTPSRPFTRH